MSFAGRDGSVPSHRAALMLQQTGDKKVAIKITKSSDTIRVDTLTTLILGNPGIGKSTLANTAEKPFVLAFDEGWYRALRRPDGVRVNTWKDIEDLEKSDLAGYKTIVVDTVGHCLDSIVQDILATEPGLGNAGTLKIQGYGRLKTRFVNWLRMVRGWGFNVVLLAHAIEEKQGEDVKLRVDGAGSGKEEVYKVADLMGRLWSQNNKRFLSFDPADNGFGKNPAGLPAEVVPDANSVPDYLAQRIRTTCDHLSQESQEGVKEQKRLDGVRDLVTSLDGVDAFSTMVERMVEANAPKSDRGLLMAEAKKRGYEFDRDTKKFTDPNATTEVEENAETEEAF